MVTVVENDGNTCPKLQTVSNGHCHKAVSGSSVYVRTISSCIIPFQLYDQMILPTPKDVITTIQREVIIPILYSIYLH